MSETEVKDDEVLSVPSLNELERQIVDLFVDGTRVLGLPRSIGEIYGLLFVSRQPLSLDDLVMRLGISKGSASQGLKTLRELGAVRDVQVAGVRRAHYEAGVELKRLAGGFIKEQVRPHLDSGQLKVAHLQEAVAAEEDPEERKFYEDRVVKLEGWMKRGRMLLPLMQKILGQ